MIIQPVNDIARICYLKGIRNVVLSPGSRCAPLTLAFSRHKGFDLYSIADERSAGFIALGLAEVSSMPTVLVCTSGTAVLNYAPAIAEAFYRHIPLVVLTADRPEEWIDQWDGQTIRQSEIYKPHILRSFNFPSNFDHPDSVWFAHRLVNEAINVCKGESRGPVHLNVPLREPFYPESHEIFDFTKDLKIVEELKFGSQPDLAEIVKLSGEFESFAKVIVVVGQQEMNPTLLSSLSVFSLKLNVPIIGDIISNMHGFAGTIRHVDSFLDEKRSELKPDLLITIGQSVISKNLKLFLRKYPATAHWHISGTHPVADPMQSLSRVVRGSSREIFDTLANKNTPKDSSYRDAWMAKEEAVGKNFRNIFEGQPFNEFEAVYRMMKSLTGHCHLHLSNSMPVRYANLVGLFPEQNQVVVHANRGTSGIDGSTSTAVGVALQSKVPNLLITGDVAFFYDINALWNNYLPPNLKIFLLNNHGGGIFRLLPGSSQQPELEEFFETRQARKANRMAEEFGLSYFHATDRNGFNNQLLKFMQEEKPAIFEVETEKEHNQEFYHYFKTQINT